MYDNRFYTKEDMRSANVVGLILGFLSGFGAATFTFLMVGLYL